MSRRRKSNLGFLIGQESSADEAGAQLETEAPAREVAIAEITANPWQPRRQFDDERIQELARSIRVHGLLQPLVVRRRAAGGFQLVAGERRLRAAREAGLSSVPVFVRDTEDEQMLAVALVENVQRQDLDPIERARAFRRLSEEQRLSHAELANVSGLGRSTISNILRLLDLEPEMQQALQNGQIREGHARSLLAEKDPVARQRLFEEMTRAGWTVRQAEDEVADRREDATDDAESGAPTDPSRKVKRKQSKSREARRLEKQMSEQLGLTVTIRERGKRGRVEIAYTTLEEFDVLFQRLCGQRPQL